MSEIAIVIIISTNRENHWMKLNLKPTKHSSFLMRIQTVSEDVSFKFLETLPKTL